MSGLTQRQWSPTKRRGPISAEFRSPGPACVSLPSLIGKTVPDSKRGRAPAFSFGSRHSLKNESPGPGPGQYNVSGLSVKGKNKAPALSLHGYTKIEKIECTPAPGDYDPEKAEIFIQDSSPKYSFGIKAPIEKINSTPAPNVYTIPSAFGATKEGNKKAAPAYSIASRQKVFTDDRILVPGPGTYEAIDPDIVRSKSAAYSISGRYQLPTDQSKIPAPGVYCPVDDLAVLNTLGSTWSMRLIGWPVTTSEYLRKIRKLLPTINSYCSPGVMTRINRHNPNLLSEVGIFITN